MSATNPVTEYACKMPEPSVPYVDVTTGQQSREWFRWSVQIMARTGGLPGIGSSDVLSTANTAQSTATTAQGTATAAQTTATGAQGTADTALATATAAQATADANTAAIAAETAARIAADALKAPLASPHFTGTALFAGGIGVWGHGAPGAQPATPVLLSDVVTILQQYGLCA